MRYSFLVNGSWLIKYQLSKVSVKMSLECVILRTMHILTPITSESLKVKPKHKHFLRFPTWFKVENHCHMSGFYLLCHSKLWDQQWILFTFSFPEHTETLKTTIRCFSFPFNLLSSVCSISNSLRCSVGLWIMVK